MAGTYFGMTEAEKQKMREQLLREQMDRMAMPPQQQNVIGGAGTDVQPMQGEITAAQQAAISKARNAPYAGQAGIQAVKSPNFGTALAKTLAAGVNRWAGDKQRKPEITKLRKAAQAEADKLLKDETRDAEREAAKDLRAEGYLDIARKNAIKTPRYSASRTNYKLEDGTTVSVTNNPDTGMPENSLGQPVDLSGAEEIYRPYSTRSGSGKGLSTSQRNKLDTSNALLSEVDSVIAAIENFEKTGKEFNENNFATYMEGVGASVAPKFTQWAMSKFGDEDENKVRATLERLSSSEIYDKYKGSLTGTEAARAERWGIGSFGIGSEATLNRLGFLRDNAMRQVEEISGGVGQRPDVSEGRDEMVRPEGVSDEMWERLTPDQKLRFLARQ